MTTLRAETQVRGSTSPFDHQASSCRVYVWASDAILGVGGKFLDLSLLSESEAHFSICLLGVGESFESLFMVPEGTLFNIPLVDFFHLLTFLY